jgi:hypothetical protein
VRRPYSGTMASARADAKVQKLWLSSEPRYQPYRLIPR